MKIAQIQGLRGIAVLAVVLFHSQISAFSHGYLGVDIFFVISGFIVTWAVWPQIQAGKFSALSFFAARIARLFPALAVVTLVVLLLSYRIQPLFEFRENLVDAIASLFYLSNFRFFLSLDYFAVDALHRPFTHFWSLGVEEQFYLGFPAMALLAGRPRVFIGLIVLSALAYLVLSIYSAPAGFYLPFGRAFQFLAGSLIAVQERRTVRSSAILLISGAGAAFAVVLVWNAINLRDIDPWPFAATGLTLAAIAYRNKLPWLGWRPLSVLGNFSYSLYLVHWPIVVFLFVLGWPTSQAVGLAAYAVASLVSAFVLHHGVELPIQRLYKSGRLRRLPLVFVSLAAAAIPIAAYGRLQAANTDDISDWALNLNAKMAETWRFSNAAGGPFAQDGRPKVVVVGDSTAKDFFNSLYLNAYPFDLRYRAVSHQCGLSMHPPLADANEAAKCSAAAQALTEEVATSGADVVIFASYWEPFERTDAFEMIDAMKAQTNAKFVVVGPPVFYGTSVAEMAYDQIKDGGSLNTVLINLKLSARGRDESIAIGQTAAVHGLPYIDRWSVLCLGLSCPVVTDEGKLVQSDKFHLTENGAKYFGNRLRGDPVMAGLL